MVKTPNRPTIRCKLQKKQDFKETFLFLKITFWKKKTLTSLVNYSTLLSSTEITFQNKEKYSTQYNYSILQLEYFFLASQRLGPAHTPLGSPGRGLLQLDRPEAVTKYKLVILIKRIMILVFWEKSFKGKEADYSNRLTRSLLASCKGISPSPWIHCDKIKSLYQRCQVLGTHNLGTPRVWHN